MSLSEKEKFGFGKGLKFLSENDLDAIHEATLNVLETVGCKMANKRAQDLMEGYGCTIDREKDIIHFPRNVVEDALDWLPSPSYTHYGIDPSKDYEVEPNRVYIGNSGIAPFIYDLYTGERRSTTLNDVRMTARIIDAIDVFPNYMLTVPANDVPPEVMSLYQSYVILTNTSKSFTNMHDNPWLFGYQLRMYELVAGGKEAFKERPFTRIAVDPVSPLEILGDEIEMLFMAIDAGMTATFFTDSMSASTSPATLAGALVCINAETLAGVTLAQHIKKGTRCNYGTSSTIMDFKSMNTPIGAPEHALITCGVIQLAHRYKLNTIVGGT